MTSAEMDDAVKFSNIEQQEQSDKSEGKTTEHTDETDWKAPEQSHKTNRKTSEQSGIFTIVEEAAADGENQHPDRPSVADFDYKISELDLKVAATLVADARDGRYMTFKRDMKSIRAYHIYKHWSLCFILYLCIWGNLLLAFMERPAHPLLELPYWESMIFETMFLAYFLFRFLHNYYFDQPGQFWKDRNIILAAAFFLVVADMVCYLIWNAFDAGTSSRWSRVLRPAFLLFFPDSRQVRKAAANIRRTIPDIIFVLILLLCSLTAFSLMGLKLFKKRQLLNSDGSEYFQNFFDTFWEMYVLLTTSNSPDIMLPASDASRIFVVLFVAALIINHYIFMSIILAVTYLHFKQHLKTDVEECVFAKRQALVEAFDILKVPYLKGEHGVPKSRWKSLMKLLVPFKSDLCIEIMHSVLDPNNTEYICQTQFLRIADLLNVPLEEVTLMATCMEKTYPSCYLSSPSEFIKTMVRHKYFVFFIDIGILANAFCIGFNITQVEWFFLAFFIVEILLKFYTYGLVKFFHCLWNTFDFVVIVLALIFNIYDEVTKDIHIKQPNNMLDFILVIRLLRLVRFLGHIKQFKIIISTLVSIAPLTATYGTVVLMIYYVYAIIGMEVFGGLIRHYGYKNLTPDTMYCGNPALNGSEFFIKQYCGDNFNELGGAMLVLFVLMVVNQWHVLSQGFEMVTNKASRLFFISFHIITVILLLNIFTAFVLEVFLVEYTLSTTNKLHQDINDKISDFGLALDEGGTDEGASKKLGSKTAERFFIDTSKRKKMEILLQGMFEMRQDAKDLGPDIKEQGFTLRNSLTALFKGFHRV